MPLNGIEGIFLCVYDMWGQWHSRDWLFTELPGGQGQSMLSFNYPKTLGGIANCKADL